MIRDLKTKGLLRNRKTIELYICYEGGKFRLRGYDFNFDASVADVKELKKCVFENLREIQGELKSFEKAE